MTPAIRPSILILVMTSAVQPFALNVLAPATPAIAAALRESYGTIQLTLTVYLAAVALSQLLVGPLSDRIGRRPCIVGGLALFTLGSLAGLFASELWSVLAARVLQAMGAGTAFALTRAIARDVGDRDQAASLIGYVTTAMVVVPMLAPLLGGKIEQLLGWRAIFGAMALLGLVSTISALLKLPETRKPGTAVGGWLDTFRALPALLHERAFLAYAVGLAMTSAVFFFFITMSGSYMIGNFITGRFGPTVGAEKLARIGNWMSVAGVGAALAFALTLEWHPALLFLPLMLNGVGNGLSIPNLTASALSVRPEMAGSAAGLMGFGQLSLGAACSYLSGMLTPLWAPAFIAMMFLGVVLAALAPLINRAKSA
jgi:MFS transporter, DHA1 family, multidrug resistance protein